MHMRTYGEAVDATTLIGGHGDGLRIQQGGQRLKLLPRNQPDGKIRPSLPATKFATSRGYDDSAILPAETPLGLPWPSAYAALGAEGNKSTRRG